MRIEVVGKHMTVTDAIREYAHTKAAKLVKFLDLTQQIKVFLQQQKHNEFEVEVVVDVEHHDDFVAHAKAPDLYAAIDLAVDKTKAQLTAFKEKLKQPKR